MKEGGWTVADAANATGSLERQSYRWPAYCGSGGALTLADRSSAPQRCKPGELTRRPVRPVMPWQSALSVQAFC